MDDGSPISIMLKLKACTYYIGIVYESLDEMAALDLHSSQGTFVIKGMKHSEVGRVKCNIFF